MYRIAVCEDEPSITQENEALLCRVLESRGLRREVDFSVDAYPAAEPLLEFLREQPAAFDLLLLDIRLVQEGGIELAHHVRAMGAACSIIFVTAYQEYMPDSFAVRPLDYLIKPMDEQKLAAALDWDLRRNYQVRQLLLPVKGGVRAVPAQDILYAEATSHKSAVHLRDETVYVSQTFRELLPRLYGDCFCRCHNSIVVNLKHVRKRTNRGLLLDNGTELPVSRTRQKEVAQQFVAFLES